MPVFSVDIEKRLGSEFWSNRYLVDASNLGVAQVHGEALVEVERDFHGTPVLFNRLRVSHLGEGNEEYVIVPIGTNGQRNVDSGLLPLFNTLRMDFTATSGRPSRKYYRGVLAEGDISGDAIVTDFSTAAASVAERFKATVEATGVIDPQGQLLTAAIVHPYVQMRQLRRSRRRRANGGGIFQ